MNLSLKSNDISLTKVVKTFILLLVDIFHLRGKRQHFSRFNHNIKSAVIDRWCTTVKTQLKKTERKGETPMRSVKTEDLSQVTNEFSEILDGIKKFERNNKESVSSQAHEIRELRSRCRNVYQVLSKKCREFAGVR